MNDDNPFPDLSGEPCAPPEPGRVDLVISGDLTLHLKGAGVVYSGAFDVCSNDVTGLGSEPFWTLHYSDTLSLTVGRDKNEKHFRSTKSSPGVERVGDVFHVDAQLRSNKRGTAHMKGTVSVPREAAGTVPDDVAAILARETRAKADAVRENGKAAVEVDVPPEEVRDLVAGVREKLPTGWVAYIGDTGWANAKRKKMRAKVVVGPGRDQWDIMRLAYVDATNHGVTVEGLIKTIRGYHERLGLDIWRADRGSIEADIERLPADVAAFAAEVYKFCPDIVDQGLETVDALAAQIRETKRLSLWWD